MKNPVLPSSRLPVLLPLLVSLSLAIGYAPPAPAATEITAVIILTNNPAGLTSNLVVNIGTADTRNPTNDVTGVESTHWMVTNTIAWARSNLFLQISAYPVFSAGSGTPQLAVSYSSTNTAALELTAPLNTNLTVTAGSGWLHISYFTNTFSDANPILTPTNAMSARVRTNAQNAIVNLLAINSATNAIPTNTTAFRNYVDTNTPQSVANKTLTAAVLQGPSIINATNLTGTNVNLTNVTLRLATITGGTYSGFIGSLTNGTGWSNTLYRAILSDPTTTNLVNYGNAIRSEGSGGNSLQIGSNAISSGALSMAIGNNALATGDSATALGIGAIATNDSAIAIGKDARTEGGNGVALGASSITSTNGIAIGQGATATVAGTAIGQDAIASIGLLPMAIGQNAQASGHYSIAFGISSSASEANSIAIGLESVSAYSNSVALGASATTTTTNQIRLGVATSIVSIPGALTNSGNADIVGKVQIGTATNNTWTGTNTLNGRLDFTSRANAGLVNGANSAILLGSNVFVRLSGATTVAGISGFAAEQDGSFHVVQFSGAITNVIVNEANSTDIATDATAANRIVTGTGTNYYATNSPLVIPFIYDATAARWKIVNFLR